MRYVKSYRLERENHTPITREMLEEEFNNAKYNNVRIHFYYPREGDIQIEFER
jgi:NADPH-dependent 7-cyano-7-deazaguanine reductase QueF